MNNENIVRKRTKFIILQYLLTLSCYIKGLFFSGFLFCFSPFKVLLEINNLLSFYLLADIIAENGDYY